MGLQHILESQISIPVDGEGGHENALVQRRARTHFWLGEWYLRYFLSSGHPRYVVESIYHRLACINYLKYAKPSKLNLKDPGQLFQILNYRSTLLCSCIIEITKTLKESRDSIKYWMHDSYGLKQFERDKFFGAIGIKSEALFYTDNSDGIETIKVDVETLESWLKDKLLMKSELRLLKKFFVKELLRNQNRPASSDLESIELLAFKWFNHRTSEAKPSFFIRQVSDVIQLLDIELLEVKEQLIRTAGLSEKNSAVYSRRIYSSQVGLNIGQVFEGNYLTESSSKSWGETLNFYKYIIKATVKHNEVPGKQKENYLKFRIPPSETHWSREQEKKLDEVFVALETFKIKPLKHYFANLKNQWVTVLFGEHQKTLLLVQLLTALARDFNEKASLEGLLQEKRKRDGKLAYPKACWVIVTGICWLAMELLLHLRADFFQIERRLRLRIQLEYGIALSRLGRFYEAHRRFNEASSYLEGDFSNDYLTNLGVVRLCRTEAHIAIIENILSDLSHFELDSFHPNKLSKSPNSYYWFHSRLDKFSGDINELTDTEQAEIIKEDLGRILAVKIDDASISLKAAERLLVRADRTGVHWWKLYLLKLNLINLAFSKHLSYKPIMQNRNKDYIDQTNRILNKAWLQCTGDAYKKLRIFHAYFSAMETSIIFNEGVESKSQAFKSIFRPIILEALDCLGLKLQNNKLTFSEFKELLLKSHSKSVQNNMFNKDVEHYCQYFFDHELYEKLY